TNGTTPSTKYTKEEMLGIYEVLQSKQGALTDGLATHLVGGWQPDITNGAAAGWGRGDNHRDTLPGPDLAWDREGTSEPLGLVEMDDEEREVCR
ncbi:UNVERIFIED_CONTAM: hypothetical protein NY603_21710, partial [Bacteroidetes bacterium 56_B9]